MPTVHHDLPMLANRSTEQTTGTSRPARPGAHLALGGDHRRARRVRAARLAGDLDGRADRPDRRGRVSAECAVPRLARASAAGVRELRVLVRLPSSRHSRSRSSTASVPVPALPLELGSNLAARILWLLLVAGSAFCLVSARPRARIIGMAGLVIGGLWALDEAVALGRSQTWSAGQMLSLAAAMGLVVVSALIAREIWPGQPGRMLGTAAFVSRRPARSCCGSGCSSTRRRRSRSSPRSPMPRSLLRAGRAQLARSGWGSERALPAASACSPARARSSWSCASAPGPFWREAERQPGSRSGSSPRAALVAGAVARLRDLQVGQPVPGEPEPFG